VNGCEEDEANMFPPVEELVPFAAGRPVTAGVVGPDPGMEGSDSINDAPNDDDGLKGFSPTNPVSCGLTGAVKGVCIDGDDEVFVAPVG